jgi:hypothetical protein
MAAEEAKTDSPSPSVSAPSAGGGGSNKLVLILIAVNMLVTLGMIGVLFMSYQKEKNAPKVEDIAVHSGVRASPRAKKAAATAKQRAIRKNPARPTLSGEWSPSSSSP